MEIARPLVFTEDLRNNESPSIFSSTTASESFRWEAVPELEITDVTQNVIKADYKQE